MEVIESFLSQTPNKMKIPKNWTAIEGASNYAISPDDYIVNLTTAKRMRRFRENAAFYSRIYNDDGVQCRVCHSSPSVVAFSIPDVPMRVIPDYPDYKVTNYGAVWKYRKTGTRRRNMPFLVKSLQKFDSEYLRLKTEDGRSHWIRLKVIMEDVWSDIDICR